MIGLVPVASLAPLEYRCGLDAAMPLIGAAHAGTRRPLVLCNAPALEDEVRQRLPHPIELDPAEEGAAHYRRVDAALWIEPLISTWLADLDALRRGVKPGGRLVVITSQPLARALPGRQSWHATAGASAPLGFTLGGMHRLLRRLVRSGFRLEMRCGLHSPVAIAASILSAQLERWRRPDVADTLHFWARRHYSAFGLGASWSTVGLVVARKGAGPCIN